MRSLLVMAALAGAACAADGMMPGTEELADRPDGDPTALVGTCELRSSGAPCTGVTGEDAGDRIFAAIGADDAVQMVTGPQGATMFVLAVRTSGMYPGDPADPVSPDNPDVAVVVRRATGEELAHYRGRPPFYVDDASQALTAVGLFVVLDEPPTAVNGDLVDTSVAIRDRDGLYRWGEATFTAMR